VFTFPGRRNLAPYSYFGVMSHDPPHVCIGICASRSKPGGQKDTLRNILDTKGRALARRVLSLASVLPVLSGNDGSGLATPEPIGPGLVCAEFTLSMMSDWFVESANHTCGEFDADVDELELVGLTPIPSVKVTPPRVKESAVHMECKLVHTYPVRFLLPPSLVLAASSTPSAAHRLCAWLRRSGDGWAAQRAER
jgi:hypothetical protein